jgi:hypothetical protein
MAGSGLPLDSGGTEHRRRHSAPPRLGADNAAVLAWLAGGD